MQHDLSTQQSRKGFTPDRSGEVVMFSAVNSAGRSIVQATYLDRKLHIGQFQPIDDISFIKLRAILHQAGIFRRKSHFESGTRYEVYCSTLLEPGLLLAMLLNALVYASEDKADA